MPRNLTLALLLALGLAAWPAPPDATGAHPIDARLAASLAGRGLALAEPCSDEVFVRRIHLDVLGRIPEPGEVRAFLRDNRPGKRAALIDRLLADDEAAEYAAMRWCDLLRVKAEFPINLWPAAAACYHRWVYDAMRDNMHYDVFARQLLTSSGSNFREAPVNFYRAVQGREPAALAGVAALTFMGARTDAWPEARRDDMAAFFSRITFKPTGEWKEEIVCLGPAPAGALAATFPDGATVVILPDADPRAVFADWLISPGNPWFARCGVNRLWAWCFGRGIIHEPDDIRDDNPPVHPELLAWLEEEFVRSGYDARHMLRLIYNSRAYQQSCVPRAPSPDADALFACYPVRRLEAEVLIDALCWIGGAGERYESAIPEPFTFIPEYQRTVALSDGSISSSFLETFGRPPRDTGAWSERGTEPTDGQRLHLLNSSHVQRKITRSWRLRAALDGARRDRRQLVQTLYLGILSRPATPDEMKMSLEYLQAPGTNAARAAEDLAWALVNTKEFLYRH